MFIYNDTLILVTIYTTLNNKFKVTNTSNYNTLEYTWL